MKAIARMMKVTCQYDYQVARREETEGMTDEVSTWNFGSWEEAIKFCYDEKDRGLNWFTIEDQSYFPCDENNPDGKLHIGVNKFYSEFLQPDGTWK